MIDFGDLVIEAYDVDESKRTIENEKDNLKRIGYKKLRDASRYDGNLKITKAFVDAFEGTMSEAFLKGAFLKGLNMIYGPSGEKEDQKNDIIEIGVYETNIHGSDGKLIKFPLIIDRSNNGTDSAVHGGDIPLVIILNERIIRSNYNLFFSTLKHEEGHVRDYLSNHTSKKYGRKAAKYFIKHNKNNSNFHIHGDPMEELIADINAMEETSIQIMIDELKMAKKDYIPEVAERSKVKAKAIVDKYAIFMKDRQKEIEQYVNKHPDATKEQVDQLSRNLLDQFVKEMKEAERITLIAIHKHEKDTKKSLIQYYEKTIPVLKEEIQKFEALSKQIDPDSEEFKKIKELIKFKEGELKQGSDAIPVLKNYLSEFEKYLNEFNQIKYTNDSAATDLIINNLMLLLEQAYSNQLMQKVEEKAYADLDNRIKFLEEYGGVIKKMNEQESDVPLYDYLVQYEKQYRKKATTNFGGKVKSIIKELWYRFIRFLKKIWRFLKGSPKNPKTVTEYLIDTYSKDPVYLYYESYIVNGDDNVIDFGDTLYQESAKKKSKEDKADKYDDKYDLDNDQGATIEPADVDVDDDFNYDSSDEESDDEKDDKDQKKSKKKKSSKKKDRDFDDEENEDDDKDTSDEDENDDDQFEEDTAKDEAVEESWYYQEAKMSKEEKKALREQKKQKASEKKEMDEKTRSYMNYLKGIATIGLNDIGHAYYNNNKDLKTYHNSLFSTYQKMNKRRDGFVQYAKKTYQTNPNSKPFENTQTRIITDRRNLDQIFSNKDQMDQPGNEMKLMTDLANQYSREVNYYLPSSTKFGNFMNAADKFIHMESYTEEQNGLYYQEALFKKNDKQDIDEKKETQVSENNYYTFIANSSKDLEHLYKTLLRRADKDTVMEELNNIFTELKERREKYYTSQPKSEYDDKRSYNGLKRIIDQDIKNIEKNLEIMSDPKTKKVSKNMMKKTIKMISNLQQDMITECERSQPTVIRHSRDIAKKLWLFESYVEDEEDFDLFEEGVSAKDQNKKHNAAKKEVIRELYTATNAALKPTRIVPLQQSKKLSSGDIEDIRKGLSRMEDAFQQFLRDSYGTSKNTKIAKIYEKKLTEHRSNIEFYLEKAEKHGELSRHDVKALQKSIRDIYRDYQNLAYQNQPTGERLIGYGADLALMLASNVDEIDPYDNVIQESGEDAMFSKVGEMLVHLRKQKELQDLAEKNGVQVNGMRYTDDTIMNIATSMVALMMAKEEGDPRYARLVEQGMQKRSLKVELINSYKDKANDLINRYDHGPIVTAEPYNRDIEVISDEDTDEDEFEEQFYIDENGEMQSTWYQEADDEEEPEEDDLDALDEEKDEEESDDEDDDSEEDDKKTSKSSKKEKDQEEDIDVDEEKDGKDDEDEDDEKEDKEKEEDDDDDSAEDDKELDDDDEEIEESYVEDWMGELNSFFTVRWTNRMMAQGASVIPNINN